MLAKNKANVLKNYVVKKRKENQSYLKKVLVCLLPR